MSSVPARGGPIGRDGRRSGGGCGVCGVGRRVVEEAPVVDGAEREEVGDAVEVLQAAAALAALARRRRLVRLHLFLNPTRVGRGRS